MLRRKVSRESGLRDLVVLESGVLFGGRRARREADMGGSIRSGEPEPSAQVVSSVTHLTTKHGK